jgi:hypothetical protein
MYGNMVRGKGICLQVAAVTVDIVDIISYDWTFFIIISIILLHGSVVV